MIVQMVCWRPVTISGIAVLIQTRLSETLIRLLVVTRKVQAVLYQWRARVGIVAHSVAVNDGVHQRQREQKND